MGRPAPLRRSQPKPCARLVCMWIRRGQTWRVSWNPKATALDEARNGQLFVREGDEQKRFDLFDWSSGLAATNTARWKRRDFPAEVVDKAGRVSPNLFADARGESADTATPPPCRATAGYRLARITQPKPILQGSARDRGGNPVSASKVAMSTFACASMPATRGIRNARHQSAYGTR